MKKRIIALFLCVFALVLGACTPEGSISLSSEKTIESTSSSSSVETPKEEEVEKKEEEVPEEKMPEEEKKEEKTEEEKEAESVTESHEEEVLVDESGLRYALSYDKSYYVVAGYDGEGPDVHIPGSYKGKKVRAIASEAFNHIYTIKNLTIDEGVEYLGSGCFEGTEDMKTLSLPKTVHSLSGTAIGCVKVTIDSENPYMTIDPKLGQFLVFNKDKTVLLNCLQDCQTFTIPDGVTEIGNGAFLLCRSLEKVIIPEGVTKIGSSAFYYCEWLEEINFPSTLKYIGHSAFKRTNFLELDIPEGVEYIGRSAFDTGYQLKKITLPSTLTYLGKDPFNYCGKLKEINFRGNEIQWSKLNYYETSGNPFPTNTGCHGERWTDDNWENLYAKYIKCLGEYPTINGTNKKVEKLVLLGNNVHSTTIYTGEDGYCIFREGDVLDIKALKAQIVYVDGTKTEEYPMEDLMKTYKVEVGVLGYPSYFYKKYDEDEKKEFILKGTRYEENKINDISNGYTINKVIASGSEYWRFYVLLVDYNLKTEYAFATDVTFHNEYDPAVDTLYDSDPYPEEVTDDTKLAMDVYDIDKYVG